MRVRTLALLAFLALSALAAGIWTLDRSETHHAYIGAGNRQGDAFALAAAVARVTREHHPGVQAQVVETLSSDHSLRLLDQGRIQLAAVHASAAVPSDARLVALLYPDVFQLVAREGAQIQSVAALRGRRVALPPASSAEAQAFWLLAQHHGLGPEDVQTFPMTTPAGLFALRFGAVDALFRLVPARNRDVLSAIERAETHLVPIGQAVAMGLQHPELSPRLIPKGAYRGQPPAPTRDLQTAQIDRILLARSDLSDVVVHTITSILFERRQELRAVTALAAQVAAPERTAGTLVPIHPGAAQFYRGQQVPSRVVGAKIFGPLMGVATLIALGLLALTRQRQRQRLEQHNDELRTLGAEIQSCKTVDELDLCRDRLREFVARALDENARDDPSPAVAWVKTDSLLREREIELRDTYEPPHADGPRAGP